MDKGLYLLPNVLERSLDHAPFFPSIVGECVCHLDGIIGESEKETRHYLKRFTPHFRTLPIALLNEHTESIDPLLPPLQRGERWGLLADGGLPILADPGATLVFRLNRLNIPVHTFPGPSSLIYALQLSGLPAQSFTFHGYPERKEFLLKEMLRTLPKKQTHLFIEAPYRSDRLLNQLIEFLQEKTQLFVGWNLTMANQGVRTASIGEWKKNRAPLGKVPALFAIYRD